MSPGRRPGRGATSSGPDRAGSGATRSVGPRIGRAAPTMGAMTTTLPPSIPPRLVEHEDPERRAPRSGGLLPAQTLRGAVAGAEAAIGSWLVVVVLALAGYVATAAAPELGTANRKSTRLNSSHVKISYAVFCLKKKRSSRS